MSIKKTDAPILDDYDITMNNIKKENLFKGTIIICIIYAIFAFILLILSYFSDKIKNLLFSEFLPFTLIFIIGTIIIVSIFVTFIIKFKPKKYNKDGNYDDISCPDYWKLEMLDDNVINDSFDPSLPTNYFKYKCVMDDKIFDKYNIISSNNLYDTGNPYKITNFSMSNSILNGTANLVNIDRLNFSDNTKTIYSKAILNNSNYLNMYKNINSYNSNNFRLSNVDKNTDISNILDKLKEKSLIMNNYKLTSNNGKIYYDNLLKSSNVYNYEKPITWMINNSISSDLSTGTPNNNRAMIINWNNVTPEKIRNNFGSSNVNVFIVGTGSTINYDCIVGKLEFQSNVNTSTSNLIFKPNNSITIDGSINSSSLGTLNYKINNKDYIFETKLKAHPSNSAESSSMSGPIVKLYNIDNRPDILNIDGVSSGVGVVNFSAVTNIPLLCDNMYPLLLASDEDKYPNKNSIRCAYSKICGIPWSDMNCD